jgi:hypothetical protein
MSDPHFRRLALQLATFATQTALPLWSDTKASLGPAGLAYLGSPSPKRSGSLWFRQTKTFQAAQDAGSPLPADQQEYFLVVQWRRLLGKGLLQHQAGADVPADLRRLAHHAWWALIPLVRRHDIVMATLLERAQKNFNAQTARAAHESFWVGFDNELDERRFDKQAIALLNSRRTPENDRNGFCEEAARWFAEGLDPVVHTASQRTIALCTVARHVRGGHCSTCPEVANERPLLLVLDVPLLSDPKIRQLLTTPKDEDQRTDDPSLRVEALRWIADTCFPDDGVFRFTLSNGAPARLIDFGRLRKVWRELGFPTPFDSLAGPETTEGPRESVRFFERMMHGTLTSNRYDERGLFLDAGWGEPQDYEPLYGGYAAVLDSALLYQIGVEDQRAAALLKARQHVPPKRTNERPARRRIIRMFESPGAEPVAIGIIRAKTQGKRTLNFFTTPYEVHDPLVNNDALRVGRGIKDQGVLHWSLQTLNYFANQMTGTEPMYPNARAFVEWAAGIDADLCDRKQFNEAVYSDRLPARLAAIARGERHHLGPFSRYEDEQIEKFFTANQKKKRLTMEEWAVLLQALPGRSRVGVLRRFEELGRRYAFANGYAVYVRSPYCRKFSNARRRQWIKEGCAP